MNADKEMTDQVQHNFYTTHWTQVVAARGDSPEARQALHALCERYYGPVELFVRRYRDRSNAAFTDEARDLTHEFFARLLEGRSLDHADRTHGRFRSYLLGAVKHFAALLVPYISRLARGRRQRLSVLAAAFECSVAVDSVRQEVLHGA